MNIEYDFDDVLILPNRSNISSRNDVKLERKFKFYHSPKELTCIPIIASNMLTTGTEEVARILRKHKMITCLHKYHSQNELERILRTYEETYVWISIGLNELDKVKFLSYLSPNIVIDVPNGYMQSLPDYCAQVREASPTSIISCGNVCTLEMCQELIMHGKVDIVKTGIGPGCFVAGSIVKTIDGNKNIEDIQIGEQVLTHTGSYQEVTNVLTRIENDCIYSINNIKCTKNHEFYVVHKNDIDKINETNLEQYAIWIEASNLNENYCLVEITD